MGRLNIPSPGAYILGKGSTGSRVSGTSDASSFRRPSDKRIQWLNSVGSQLRTERQTITAEMKRNRELYDDKHWTAFGSGRRAPWKFPGVINMCAYIADRKSALIADAKPKAAFSTPRLEDTWQAEIMNAAFQEWYEDDHIQNKCEQASKLSIIRKVSYLKTGYDPMANDGQGGITAKVVDGINVYLNREASSIFDAEIVLHEYTEAIGSVLERWENLIGDQDIYAGISTEGDDEESETLGGSGTQPRLQPAQRYLSNNGTTMHTAPYAAPQSSAQFQREGTRCLVREVWTRPRGPRYQIDVDALDFTVAGQINTERKFLEFQDGHPEPLQTVVMGNRVVYELPISVVPMLQFAGDVLGGVKVVSAQDTLIPILTTKKVPLYPAGRRMIAVGNAIAEDGANPFGHGKIPIIKIQENYGLDYYPRTSIDRAASMQDCANRLFSMIFDAALLTANPIWRMPTNSDISDEEITNAPGAVQREDPTSLKLGKREPGPDMPPYVMQYLEFVMRTMDKMSGLTDVAQGGKTKGQQSAETVSMYQEAASIAFRPSMRLMEQAMTELGNQFAGNVAQFYTNERYVRLRRESGVDQHIRYVGTRLSADMKMQAKAGSMLPTSPSARFNFILNLLNTPAMDIPELLRACEEIGLIDSASAH
jgi:hypothetical protein